MALDTIIADTNYPKLRARLEKANNDGADAKRLLSITRSVTVGRIFLRIFLGLVTIGILPLLFLIGTIQHNKVNKHKEGFTKVSGNYITQPYHQIKNTLDDLKALKAEGQEAHASDAQGDYEDHEESENNDEQSELSSEFYTHGKQFDNNHPQHPFYYNKDNKFRIRFGETSRDIIKFPFYMDTTRMTPIHFEFSEKQFQFSWLQIDREEKSDLYRYAVSCRAYRAWSNVESDPLKTKEISDLILAANFRKLIRMNRTAEPDHNTIFSKSDNLTQSEIMEITYDEEASVVIIETADNNTYKVPVKLDNYNTLQRDGEIQHTHIDGLSETEEKSEKHDSKHEESVKDSSSEADKSDEFLSREHIKTCILDNGNIFACDYVFHTRRYQLSIYSPNDLDKPNLKLFESVDESIRNAVLYRKNNNNFILYVNNEEIFVLNTKGEKLASYQIGKEVYPSTVSIIPIAVDVVDGKVDSMHVYLKISNELHELKIDQDVVNLNLVADYAYQFSYNPKNQTGLLLRGYIDVFNDKKTFQLKKIATDNEIDEKDDLSFINDFNVADIALSDNAKYAVFAFKDGNVQVYSFESKSCVGDFKVDAERVFDVRFMNDDKDIGIMTDAGLKSIVNFDEKLEHSAEII